MPYSEIVNTKYGNTLNIYNPVFKGIIGALENGNLYTSALGNRTSTNPAKDFVCTFTNAAGTVSSCVALDVLCDAISREILKGYRDGFDQSAMTKDGASNIGFKLATTDAQFCVGTNLSSALDVNKALVALASEITTLKTALGTLMSNPSLGLAPQSGLNPINANRLTLE